MEKIAFLTVDVFIIVTVFISFVVGWARGATKEVLSLISWVGGIYLTISAFPYAKDITRSYISHGLIADFVTSCILFILFLTILSVVNYFCSNLVKKSMLNTIDKILGGVFGIIRGIIILAFLDIILNQCILSETPEYIKESKLRPITNSVSNYIILILPESIQEKVLMHMSQIKKQDLINFMQNNVINDSDNKHKDEFKNKVFALEEKLEENDENDWFDTNNEKDEKIKNQSQTAQELATLKPKKITETNDKDIDKTISQKGRKDMDRLLDQYDDIDEE